MLAARHDSVLLSRLRTDGDLASTPRGARPRPARGEVTHLSRDMRRPIGAVAACNRLDAADWESARDHPVVIVVE